MKTRGAVCELNLINAPTELIDVKRMFDTSVKSISENSNVSPISIFLLYVTGKTTGSSEIFLIFL